MLNQSKSYELNILINGRKITEYEHESNVFVEGRKGSEFEVEFKNQSNKRVLVVPSVDGKSVFDGQPATPDSRGYVVGAWSSIRIPGWTLDDQAVAKFTFEDKDKSYSAAVTPEGEPVVTGVIGVMVYAEKFNPLSVNHIHHYYPRPAPYYPGVVPRGPYDWPYNGPIWSSTCSVGSVSSTNDVNSVLRGRGMMSKGADLSSSATPTNSVDDAASSESFDMGAGFGSKSDFKTKAISFERGEVLATIQLYYDSRKNLEKRGIEVVKKEVKPRALPQAFSGVGCTPPPGWQG